MIGDPLIYSLTNIGSEYWQNLCECQFSCKDAADYKSWGLNTADFTILHKIHDGINRLHLEHLYTLKNVILSLFDLKSKIVPKDASNIYPNDFHIWIDNTGAIDLSVWINRLKPLIYESMKKAQLDNIYPFWSTRKQTSNHIAHKPCSAIYTKEFLTWNTIIHIHSENAPLVDKITSYPPSFPPQSFTMYIIPDCFCCHPPDSTPQFFTMRLIPDQFGDYPT